METIACLSETNGGILFSLFYFAAFIVLTLLLVI